MMPSQKEVAVNFVSEMKTSIGVCSVEHARQNLEPLKKFGLCSASLSILAVVEAAYDSVSSMEVVKYGTTDRTNEAFVELYKLIAELR